MNTRLARPAQRALVVAMQVALCAFAAIAQANAAAEDDAVHQQTHPENFVEIGIGQVSDDSYKFGEYNGLYDQGAFGIIDFLIRGGAGYENQNTTRWAFSASHLGLSSREVGFEYGQQGHYRFDLGYDQLRRARSDSYQTPYLGAGTPYLTLPGNWLPPRVPQLNANNINFRSLSPSVSQAPVLVGGVLVQPTPAQLTQLANIASNDTAAFHDQRLGTTRKRIEAGFSYRISPRWELTLRAQDERRNGLKPMGTVSSQVSEFSAIIPDLIDQVTHQYNLALNYSADKSFLQMGYYSSIFDNNVKSMTWQDVNDLSKTATMSSAPSNEFHQLNFTGGYHFSPENTLVLNGAYARSTQNDTFLVNAQLPLGVPVDTLDGLVVTKAFNAKFTAHPMQGLNWFAAYKYDDHDNQTAVNTYIFQDANEARAAAASAFNATLGLAPNTLGSNINIYANRPYSRKVNQVDGNVDYAISDGQTLKAAYQYQQIERGCEGSWINCADAPKTRENTGQLEWRSNFTDTLSTSLSYTYSRRTVNYDENAFLALVPMANFVPAGGATMSVYQYLLASGLTGFGPLAGFPTTPLTGDAAIFSPNNNIVPQALYGSRNNINELLGLRRFNMADRDRDKLRARLDWQASEKLALNSSLDYDRDDYSNSLYGLTGSKNWALNLDAGYTVSEQTAADVFYTYEDSEVESAGRSYGSNSNTAFVGVAGNTVVDGGCYATVQDRNRNTKIDSCLEWTTASRDKVHTLGLGLQFKGLMDGKLALSSDLVATRARTNIGITGGSYVNNPLAAAGQPPVTPAVYFIPASSMPTVTTRSTELRLNGEWRLSPSSALNLSYWFSHLKANDYIYEGMQFGSSTLVMPTNERAPSYNVHVIGLGFTHFWR